MAKAKTETKEQDSNVKMPTVQELLEAGVHFGHEVKKWNPKMSRYIFTERNGIHVIDLEKTEKMLRVALKYLEEEAAKGKQVLFVATKRQAQEMVETAAKKANSHFITTRWVGGLLTNFDNVRASIKALNDLKAKKETGELSTFTKKEQLLIDRRIKKLEANFGGVASLSKVPDIIFILDAKKEINSVREASKMGIPIVAIVDTNADPTIIDYPIPANDDAIRAIEIMVNIVAEAVSEGNKVAQKKVENEAEAAAAIAA